MYTSKKRSAKRNNRSTRSTAQIPQPGEIERLFQLSQLHSPGSKMASPRGDTEGDREACGSPDLSMDAPLTSQYLGAPPVLQTDPGDTPRTASQSVTMDPELRLLLQALPTKADITALMGMVEAAHRKELAVVKTEVKDLSTRLTKGESSLTALERRVEAMEETQDSQMEALTEQQLRLEEMEDRSRRNNLRIRGLPEATGPEDLADTVTAIFRTIEGIELPPRLEFDRIHRALGPKSSDPARPRDVVCRLHHYKHREEIIRRSWEADSPEFDGVAIKILPDLSRPTLQRRAILKPLLELARSRGATYRWGYPMSITFRRDHRFFTLRKPEALPDLFIFLDAEPIVVPDWLALLPRAQDHGNLQRVRGDPPPRQQRGRRRPRATSQEGEREL